MRLLLLALLATLLLVGFAPGDASALIACWVDTISGAASCHQFDLAGGGIISFDTSGFFVRPSLAGGTQFQPLTGTFTSDEFGFINLGEFDHVAASSSSTSSIARVRMNPATFTGGGTFENISGGAFGSVNYILALVVVNDDLSQLMEWVRSALPTLSAGASGSQRTQN